MRCVLFQGLGISVITLVFDEKVNIYFARQLIAEKFKDAESQIPQELGTPELAPVTTGLGEIYQYIIHPKKGSEQKYSAMELRDNAGLDCCTAIERHSRCCRSNRLLVVSSKQYEVAVNPDRLKSNECNNPGNFYGPRKE